MTRTHYHRLFNWIYLGFLALMMLLCILFEYIYYKTFPEAGNPLFVLRNTQTFAARNGIMLLVLPVLMTWMTAGLVWLTRKTEPLTDLERQQSFIGRLGTGQLFLPLSWLLLVPPALMICCAEQYIEVWILYLFTAAHLLVTWLMVLFLQRITRIRTTVWTVIFIILFLLSGIAYGFVSTAGLYVCSKSPDGASEEAYDQTATDLEGNGLFDDLERSLAEAPQELAVNMVQELLKVYDHYNGDPDLLIAAAGPLLHYDPDCLYTQMDLSYKEMSAEEVEWQSQARRANFDREQLLSCFFDLLFDVASFDDESAMYDRIKHLLVMQDGRYDYGRFAKQVDMLDWAYRDLMRQNEETYGGEDDEGGGIFGEIYEYASHTPFLNWEKYDGFITNPYVRYTAEQMYEKTTLVWAYTFWGRRYNDGRLSACRRLLDKVLEVHPNTLFPADKMEQQAELMRAAETRAGDFLKWYKANYWAFRELKAAQYDDAGTLIKFDSEQYGQYLHALQQSGFLAPRLLESLETAAGQAADSVRSEEVREQRGEWLRTDPLIENYEAIASEIDDIACRTERILEPDRKMCIATSVISLRAYVENINGVWFISRISTKPE